MIHNNSIQIGDNGYSNTKIEPKREQSNSRIDEEMKVSNLSNQDRINQLNGVSNNLESALSNLFS